MKVVLMKEHRNLGRVGQVVNVPDGYARNYLIPQGVAVPATPANLKAAQDASRRLQARAQQELESARRQAARLEGQSVTVTAKVGEAGRLFGSVTSRDITTALAEQHDVELDRRLVELADPIKTAGVHQVSVRFHPDVSATVEVRVDPEES